MFSGGSLAVVLVPEYDPVDAGLLVLPRHVRHAPELAVILVLDGVHHLVLGVDCRNQKVARYVLQVS